MCFLCVAEILFLAAFALHRERKRCGQVEHSSCYSQSQVVYTYQYLDLSLQGFFCQKYHIRLFCYHGNYF